MLLKRVLISPLNLKNSVTDPVRLALGDCMITLDDPVLVVKGGTNVSSGIVTFLSRKVFTFSGEDDC